MAGSGVNQLAQIPELRSKLLWTLMLLCAYRIGVHVPVPGIDAAALKGFFDSLQGSVFDLLNMLRAARATCRCSPSGSCRTSPPPSFCELLQVVSPDIKRLAKEEGQAGRRKITQYTLASAPCSSRSFRASASPRCWKA